MLGEMLRAILSQVFVTLRRMARLGLVLCHVVGPLSLSLTIVCWLVFGVALLCTLMLAFISFGPNPIGPSAVPDGEDVAYLLMGFGSCVSGGFVSSALDRTAKRVQVRFNDLAEWSEGIAERYLY